MPGPFSIPTPPPTPKASPTPGTMTMPDTMTHATHMAHLAHTDSAAAHFYASMGYDPIRVRAMQVTGVQMPLMPVSQVYPPRVMVEPPTLPALPHTGLLKTVQHLGYYVLMVVIIFYAVYEIIHKYA